MKRRERTSRNIFYIPSVDTITQEVHRAQEDQNHIVKWIWDHTRRKFTPDVDFKKFHATIVDEDTDLMEAGLKEEKKNLLVMQRSSFLMLLLTTLRKRAYRTRRSLYAQLHYRMRHQMAGGWSTQNVTRPTWGCRITNVPNGCHGTRQLKGIYNILISTNKWKNYKPNYLSWKTDR